MNRPETIEEAEERWGRPRALPEVVVYYDHEYSEKPDRMRVSFSDGSSAVYELRIEQPQPHPLIVENIQIIRRMKPTYNNQPIRRRRNA